MPRRYPPSLPIKQTSYLFSLRPILVLGLCISYSPTLNFFHIHFPDPFLSCTFNLSLELDHSQWLENMHQSFRLKGEMPSTPHFYPALNQSPDIQVSQKHYLYCGRGGLLPPKCHSPLPIVES